MARLDGSKLAALRSRQLGDGQDDAYELYGASDQHGGYPVAATIRRGTLGFAIERRGEAVKRFPIAIDVLAALRGDETDDGWRLSV